MQDATPPDRGLPPLTDNALRVLRARYLRRDPRTDVLETPADLFRRVAGALAEAERRLGNGRDASAWEEIFHDLMGSREFLPNSPALMNAGTPAGQLSACFVLPVEDSMASIFEAVKLMALVQQTGGGTGFSFSRLRPAGDLVASTDGRASGPVSFMRIFDCATENIRQGGKRRGANMGVLRVDHPDVLDFVRAKLDGSSFRNFNTSVAVTDAFMESVRSDGELELFNVRTGSPAGRLRARELFDEIAAAAWRTGDPGLLFLDAINRDNPTPALGRIEATNPCGEVPLFSFESCNLGSINLARMLADAGGGVEIDREKLRATVRKAVRFLDDIIEINRYVTPEIERMTRGNRKIGLGVMGFAEALIRLGVSYDSRAAAEVAGDLMRVIAEEALEASRALAAERGSFPNWKGSVFESRGIAVRNATRTAIAPTGTISIIAGTTPSIEPLFALAYRRVNVLDGEVLEDVNATFLEELERRGLDARGIAAAVRRHGGLGDVPGVPADLRRLFVTALEIPASRHLEIQAAFQRHVDNSVSKTINLPQQAAVGDVRDAYWRAWELGLKGITVFRYGSAPAQVLELGAGEDPIHYDHASRCDPGECRL
jgi:ribonucleoside-diphosphate reductase alpha chain